MRITGSDLVWYQLSLQIFSFDLYGFLWSKLFICVIIYIYTLPCGSHANNFALDPAIVLSYFFHNVKRSFELFTAHHFDHISLAIMIQIRVCFDVSPIHFSSLGPITGSMQVYYTYTFTLKINNFTFRPNYSRTSPVEHGGTHNRSQYHLDHPCSTVAVSPRGWGPSLNRCTKGTV